MAPNIFTQEGFTPPLVDEGPPQTGVACKRWNRR